MKKYSDFIWAIAVLLAIFIGVYADYKITAANKDAKFSGLQSAFDIAILDLNNAKAELAANHVVVLAWDELASYYTEASSGKTRSDGKPYDEEQLIVAHRTIKNGTFLMIENPENGKTSPAVVRDWGPHPKTGRSLDVSLAVAKRLGIVDKGVARLRCYYMIDGRPSKSD